MAEEEETMHSLRRINQVSELVPAQPISEEWSLAKISPEPSLDLVEGLGQLMAQVQARYPAQKLPPGTADMYLVEWYEMAVRFGPDPFKAALLRVVRDRSRPPFFPAPDEVEAECRAAARAERERKEGAAAAAEIDRLRAIWERERDEDLANGIPRGRDPKAELDGLIARRDPPRRQSDAEIEAWKAKHITVEQAEAIRERMRPVMAAELVATGT